jgi:hypothetical protein
MLPKYPNEWRDPEDIASDLIAAGVTLAATPAPLDVVALRCAAIEVVIEATSDDFDPTTREWGELIEQLESAATSPLAATPAPLDSINAPGDDGIPTGSHEWATPAPLDADSTSFSFEEALCGATLTCALPILHDGDHERADGIRWTWPAPAPLDVERHRQPISTCEACRLYGAAGHFTVAGDRTGVASISERDEAWGRMAPIEQDGILWPRSVLASAYLQACRDRRDLLAATPAPLDSINAPGDDGIPTGSHEWATPAPLDVDDLTFRSFDGKREIGLAQGNHCVLIDARDGSVVLTDVEAERLAHSLLRRVAYSRESHP